MDQNNPGRAVGPALVSPAGDDSGSVASISDPAQALRASTVTPGRRVLIIEDNVDAATTLREALEFGAHEVRVAYDGAQGVEVFREFRPQAVLCDIGLPLLDGYGVARAICAESLSPRPLLVALTGYALPEDVRRAKEAGFAWHLSKPPDVELIERLLQGIRTDERTS